MKRYEGYKNTTLPWISEIPSNWKVARNRGLLSESKEVTDNPKDTLLSLSQYTGISIKEKSSRTVGMARAETTVGYKKVAVNQLVMNIMLAWNGSTAISDYEGVISPAYAVFNIDKQCVPKYFHYQYRIPEVATYFKAYSTGIIDSRLRLYPDVLKGLYSIVPPREEQDQIVRYLDWKVSEINHLIHGYQKQIELLKERRVAVINQAVTKGIYPDVEMQPTSNNWMGDIPSHWDVDKVKQHFSIRKVIAGEEGYDVISITQQGLKIKDISSNEGQMAQSYAKYQFVRPGDFAMNHMDLLTGYVGLSEFFGVTSPDYRVFELMDTENCIKEYYLYVFQLGYKRKIFYGLGRGAANKGRWRMPAENFKNYDIPIPPIEEQREIVEYIERVTKDIDKAIDGLENQIVAFREYRTRLISDVVTGQIDVRDVVIPDYQMETDNLEEDADTEDMESEVNSDE